MKNKKISITLISMIILMILSIQSLAQSAINITFPRDNQYLLGGTDLSVRASVYHDQYGDIVSGIQWFFDDSPLAGDSAYELISLDTVDSTQDETHVIKAVYGELEDEVSVILYNQPVIDNAVEYIKDLQSSDGSFNGYNSHYYLAASLGQAGFDIGSYKNGDSTYIDYLETLPVNESTSTDDLVKLLFTITSIGEDPTDFNGKNIVQLLLNKKQGDGTFGAGVYTNVLAIIALNDAGVDIPHKTELQAYFEGLTYLDGIYATEYDSVWYPDIDTTARIVRSLKILGCDNENTVIKNALSAISASQGADGAIEAWGAPNFDTTAEVIMMLSDLGINPTEGSWSKGNNNLVSAVVSNQDSDGSFKNEYFDKKYSTYEALLALTKYYFTFNTPIEGRDSGSGNSSNGGSGSHNEEQGDIRISITVIGKDGEIIYSGNNKTLKITDTFGQTALQALVATGLSYKTRNDNTYVSEINGLRESISSTAGWKYKVNGVTPNKSAKSCTLEDGVRVEWFWVDDYTQDRANPSSTNVDEKEELEANKIDDTGTSKTSFNDVDDAKYGWAKEQIELLAEKGIINGTGEGKFEPGRSVTREEFIKMMVLLLNEKPDENDTTKFADDLSISSWAKGYIQKAKELGIIQGYADNSIRPRQTITREEMTVMLIRVLVQQKKIAIVQNSKDIQFSDAESISLWAREYIEAAEKIGLIKGNLDNAFLGKNHATRAEAAVVIFRALEM